MRLLGKRSGTYRSVGEKIPPHSSRRVPSTCVLEALVTRGTRGTGELLVGTGTGEATGECSRAGENASGEHVTPRQWGRERSRWMTEL